MSSFHLHSSDDNLSSAVPFPASKLGKNHQPIFVNFFASTFFNFPASFCRQCILTKPVGQFWGPFWPGVSSAAVLVTALNRATFQVATRCRSWRWSRSWVWSWSRSIGSKKCGYSVQRPLWNAINNVVGKASPKSEIVGCWLHGMPLLPSISPSPFTHVAMCNG